MQADVVSICYKAGFFGWVLVQAAIGVPRFLWAGLSWMSTVDTSLYWLLLASSWAFVIGAQYLAASFWLDKKQVTPSKCNNNRSAMPDLTMWLLAHYIVIIYTHEFAIGARPRWWAVLLRLVYLIGVPAILVWTQNTTIPFALAGAGFGVTSGLLCAVLLWTIWIPRLPEMENIIREAKDALLRHIHNDVRWSL